VILVDVNLLVYATNIRAREYAAARDWLDDRISGHGPVGLPWMSLLGFTRLATHPRVYPSPLPMRIAWQHVSAWLAADSVWIPQPTDRHADVLGGLLAEPGVHGNLVPDAHLAALAIEHGLTLCSTDGDFARFRKLRWINPIARP
jgi:uncharacterized protein